MAVEIRSSEREFGQIGIRWRVLKGNYTTPILGSLNSPGLSVEGTSEGLGC